MEDGDIDMDVTKRLNLLRLHQKAWDNLQFSADEIVELNAPVSGSWELQDGLMTQQIDSQTIGLAQIPSGIRGISAKVGSLDIPDVNNVYDYVFDVTQDLLVLAEPPNSSRYAISFQHNHRPI